MKVYRSPSSDRTDEAQEGEYREYEIPYEERMTVMNVLDFIQENYDRSLAFYKSCRTGRCSGCLVAINGKNQYACSTLTKDGMEIGPANKCSVVRDLIVSFPG
jgi:succinate dehydrogenase/fumarate reductase-like Fe-S protein